MIVVDGLEDDWTDDDDEDNDVVDDDGDSVNDCEGLTADNEDQIDDEVTSTIIGSIKVIKQHNQPSHVPLLADA